MGQRVVKQARPTSSLNFYSQTIPPSRRRSRFAPERDCCHKPEMRPGAILLELAAAVALAVVFAPRHARAAELLLEQPSACAIGDELPSRAELALGQSLASAASVRCTISIEREGDAFAAQMLLSTPGATAAAGQRSFRAPTCELLADTLALAVALAVGEQGAPRSGVAASAAAVAPSVVSAAVPPPTPALARVPVEPDAGASLEAEAPRRAALHGGARAGLVADAGTLPGLGLGAAIGVSLGGDRIEGRARGTYLAPREASSPSRPGAGAKFDLLAADLALCAPAVVRSSRLRAGVCLGAELGVLSARARGFSASGERQVVWRAGRLDVEGRWALARGLDLELALGALAPLVRQRFVVSELEPGFVTSWYGQTTMHRPPSIVARASIGLSVELGGGD
jgi:hypothetical protein